MTFEDMVDCFNTHDLFREKCSENNCILKNASDEYYIIHGDKLKEMLYPEDKSVDCILINKNLNYGKSDIIICELGENKNFPDIKDKTINSGEHINKIFRYFGVKVNNVYCIFLGTYKNQHSKNTRRTFNICSRNNIRIENKPRRFDIKDLISS